MFPRKGSQEGTRRDVGDGVGYDVRDAGPVLDRKTQAILMILASIILAYAASVAASS